MIRNILFVDDDQVLCKVIQKHLGKYPDNFTVITAGDGFDAIKQLKKFPVSLVIVDLMMPRLDGMSLINHLGENYPDIPCVIISSLDDSRLQEAAQAKGIIGYLKKPFQIETLVSLINEVLQKESASGIMHSISPAVFLQFMEVEAKSCTIRILDNTTSQGGVVYFSDGKMLDARIGNLQGIEAAYELFSWESATIFLQNECEPRKNVINSALTPIIMKAAAMKDEAKALRADIPAASPLRKIADTEMTVPFNPAGLELLQTREGKQLGLKRYFRDEQMADAVNHLTTLGKNNGLGEMRFACVNKDKECRIVLPGPPPMVLELEPNCPPDKFIALLKEDSASD